MCLQGKGKPKSRNCLEKKIPRNIESNFKIEYQRNKSRGEWKETFRYAEKKKEGIVQSTFRNALNLNSVVISSISLIDRFVLFISDFATNI